MCKERYKKQRPSASHQKTNLRRRKNDLRAVSSKNKSLRQKRTILQNGGFLSVLLLPLLGILGSLLLKECSLPKRVKCRIVSSSSRLNYRRRSKSQRIRRSSTPISKRSQRSARRWRRRHRQTDAATTSAANTPTPLTRKRGK